MRYNSLTTHHHLTLFVTRIDFCIHHQPSPTASLTYFSINVDAGASVRDSVGLTRAVFALKNESVFTPVRPYTTSATTSQEEHNALHSTLVNSDISFPHSYISTPIHAIPNDAESKIVATVGGLFAWDYALRNLLPDNVDGLIVELRNTCNQTSMYELVGYDAFFLGENATREAKYNEMEVFRDLTLSTHPNFTTTAGHCQYSIVRNAFEMFYGKTLPSYIQHSHIPHSFSH